MNDEISKTNSIVAHKGTELVESPVNSNPKVTEPSDKVNRNSNLFLKTKTTIEGTKKKKVKIEDLIA